ncbi:TolC family protein, partial [bacterium]|nr:TolC family protein [bacterium]
LKRFANGDITSTELARASDQLNNARLSYLAATIGYRMALADLQRKTLYDFENDRPLVGSASGP